MQACLTPGDQPTPRTPAFSRDSGRVNGSFRPFQSHLCALPAGVPGILDSACISRREVTAEEHGVVTREVAAVWLRPVVALAERVSRV